MGESVKETDQMLIIDKLNPDLIDHGVNLCTEAKEWVLNNKVPVTVCITSSIATKMHDKNAIHPWVTTHLNTNHLIHLGTDNATVFGNITLSSELLKLNSDIEFAKVVRIAKESFKRGKKWFTQSL